MPDFHNIVIDFNKSRYSCVSVNQKIIVFGNNSEGDTFQNIAYRGLLLI